MTTLTTAPSMATTAGRRGWCEQRGALLLLAARLLCVAMSAALCRAGAAAHAPSTEARAQLGTWSLREPGAPACAAGSTLDQSLAPAPACWPFRLLLLDPDPWPPFPLRSQSSGRR